MNIALGYFLTSISTLLHLLLSMFYWMLIIRAVLSWVSPDPRNPIVQFIVSCTEPLVQPVRERVKPMGMFDVSLMIVLFVLIFFDVFLPPTLCAYGNQFLLAAGAPLRAC